MRSKSSGELISFGHSDRSVRSLVLAKSWAITGDQTKKNDFTFWLIFGLSPDLGLGESSLGERLIETVKWRNVSPVTVVVAAR